MKLDKEQTEKLNKHLQEKWKPPVACGVCGANDWNISGEIYEFREFHQGNMVIGGSAIIPVIPVTCNNCGNTVFINPLVAGLDISKKENMKPEGGKK